MKKYGTALVMILIFLLVEHWADAAARWVFGQ